MADNNEVKLKIGECVMGNPYVSREIQAMCKDGAEVKPRAMVVFEDGKKQPDRAMILFGDNANNLQLALSQFYHPPSIQELMKVLPFETKPMISPIVQTTRRGRFFAAFGA